jgi:glutathione S-transferase|tara:strand:- start:2076 stop:2564 length:489 start_codon:yes stop_codon:yes gene_type:complete
MYSINPSGRVPFLLLDDGTGIEDTPVLVQYLDNLKKPRIFVDGLEHFDFQYLQIEAKARSLLDGASVWIREIRRPSNEQSPTILQHEQNRAIRLTSYFNKIVSDPLLSGSINLAQLYLFAALDLERRIQAFSWRQGNANLTKWYERMESQPSVKASWQPYPS